MSYTAPVEVSQCHGKARRKHKAPSPNLWFRWWSAKWSVSNLLGNHTFPHLLSAGALKPGAIQSPRSLAHLLAHRAEATGNARHRVPFNSYSELPGGDPKALGRILGHSDRKGGAMVSLPWQRHWIGSHQDAHFWMCPGECFQSLRREVLPWDRRRHPIAGVCTEQNGGEPEAGSKGPHSSLSES